MSETTWKQARELAALANECCHRSDGYEERLRDKIGAAINAARTEVHEQELLYRRSAVEAEREACAKIAEPGAHQPLTEWGYGYDAASKSIAQMIRARGKS
jgi:hypothetical protein